MTSCSHSVRTSSLTKRRTPITHICWEFFPPHPYRLTFPKSGRPNGDSASTDASTAFVHLSDSVRERYWRRRLHQLVRTHPQPRVLMFVGALHLESCFERSSFADLLMNAGYNVVCANLWREAGWDHSWVREWQHPITPTAGSPPTLFGAALPAERISAIRDATTKSIGKTYSPADVRMLLQRPLSRRDAHLELFGRSSTCVRYVADQGGHSPLGFVPFHLIKFDRFQPSLVLTAYCRQAVISAAYPFRNAFGVQRVCASFMGLLDSVISAPMGQLTANHSKTAVFRGLPCYSVCRLWAR